MRILRWVVCSVVFDLEPQLAGEQPVTRTIGLTLILLGIMLFWVASLYWRSAFTLIPAVAGVFAAWIGVGMMNVPKKD